MPDPHGVGGVPAAGHSNPMGQALQLAAPGVEYWPGQHCVGCCVGSPHEYPAGHGEHTARCAAEYEPDGQGAQAVAFTLENVPASHGHGGCVASTHWYPEGQGKHAVAPLCGATEPRGQAEQLTAPVDGEYAPGAHSTGCCVGSLQDDPAGHSVQTPELALYRPAAHTAAVTAVLDHAARKRRRGRRAGTQRRARDRCIAAAAVAADAKT